MIAATRVAKNTAPPSAPEERYKRPSFLKTEPHEAACSSDSRTAVWIKTHVRIDYMPRGLKPGLCVYVSSSEAEEAIVGGRGKTPLTWCQKGNPLLMTIRRPRTDAALECFPRLEVSNSF